MRFFFPDSQDQVDPGFDFQREEWTPDRNRQRDDLYAHEVLAGPVLDGLLVSKTIVDGTAGALGKYTLAQRQRLYREGARRFFRLDRPRFDHMQTMGDCGAFSYWREDVPPYTPDQVIDFYEGCGFDLGLSVDHVILGYDPAADCDSAHPQREAWAGRQQLTLELAASFLDRTRARGTRFTPVGVAQGWSPASYAAAVAALQRTGYTRIALGGVVPMKTAEILDSLKAIDGVRDAGTQLHLLGIARCDRAAEFAALGVTSVDSTSAFRQAFKDAHFNYHVRDHAYTALRVPQVDKNPKLRAAIMAGQVSQRAATARERDCLETLAGFDRGTASLDDALGSLLAYEALLGGRGSYAVAYAETLRDAPWKACSCQVCQRAGIDVAIFRGTERNKRRGFHNLHVLRQRLDQGLTAA